MGKLLYEEESFEIRGACFEVWNHFRSAFKETIVHKALEKELQLKGLKINSKKHVPVFYKDEKVGEYVPDFVINNINYVYRKIKKQAFTGYQKKRQGSFQYYNKSMFLATLHPQCLVQDSQTRS